MHQEKISTHNNRFEADAQKERAAQPERLCLLPEATKEGESE